MSHRDLQLQVVGTGITKEKKKKKEQPVKSLLVIKLKLVNRNVSFVEKLSIGYQSLKRLESARKVAGTRKVARKVDFNIKIIFKKFCK